MKDRDEPNNIDWDSAQCLTYSTNYFQRLTLESRYTNLEQTPLNRCQQLPAPHKRLIRDKSRQTDMQQTDLILTNNRQTSNRPIWLTKDGSKLTNDWWQTLQESFGQYHPGFTDQSFSTDQTYNNIDCRTNTIHLSLKMTSAQVVETSVTNNSSFQNYTHPDDHTIRTTDTPGFTPLTMLLRRIYSFKRPTSSKRPLRISAQPKDRKR